MMRRTRRKLNSEERGVAAAILGTREMPFGAKFGNFHASPKCDISFGD